MPDPTPVPAPVATPRDRWRAAIMPVGLVLLFGAGVLLVYLVNPPHPTLALPTPANTAAAARAPTPEFAAARQRITDLEATLANLRARHQAYAALGVQFTPRGLLVILGEPELQFAPAKSDLPGTLPAGLTQLAALLAQDPGLQVQIEGYTDSKGSAAANLTLSSARAAALKAALVTLGCAPERIQVKGLGAVRPVADNRTPEGRSRNRRFEVYLSEP